MFSKNMPRSDVAPNKGHLSNTSAEVCMTPARRTQSSVQHYTSPVDEKHERYLYAVLADRCDDQEMRDDLWHILTTEPVKYIEACSDLFASLVEYEHVLKNDSKVYKQYKDLVKKHEIVKESDRGRLIQCLLGCTSAYYTATSRAYDRMQTFLLHIANAVIYEKHMGVLLGKKSHYIKAGDVRKSIGKARVALKNVKNYLFQCGVTSDVVHNRIDKMSAYLKLHRRSLKIARAYHRDGPLAQLDQALKPQNATEIVHEIHPNDIRYITPMPKASSTTRRFAEECRRNLAELFSQQNQEETNIHKRDTTQEALIATTEALKATTQALKSTTKALNTVIQSKLYTEDHSAASKSSAKKRNDSFIQKPNKRRKIGEDTTMAPLNARENVNHKPFRKLFA